MIKHKNGLTRIQSNTVYISCSFDAKYEENVDASIFKHCSFRAPLIIHKLTHSQFTDCHFASFYYGLHDGLTFVRSRVTHRPLFEVRCEFSDINMSGDGKIEDIMLLARLDSNIPASWYEHMIKCLKVPPLVPPLVKKEEKTIILRFFLPKGTERSEKTLKRIFPPYVLAKLQLQ